MSKKGRNAKEEELVKLSTDFYADKSSFRLQVYRCRFDSFQSMVKAITEKFGYSEDAVLSLLRCEKINGDNFGVIKKRS
ncbi:MAG: hypothetical protein WCX74_00210 [Candidatus Paceibacterota bacterium]|jgi:hypothetical protein